MSKKTDTQVRLFHKAEQTVEETRLLQGKAWGYRNGKPFAVIRWVMFAVGIALSVLLLAQWFGLLLAKEDVRPESSGYTLLVQNTRLTLICLIAAVTATVLTLLRKNAAGGILSVAEAALFLPNQNLSLSLLVEDGGWKRLVMYTLPTVLMALCGLYLAVCVIADRVRVKRTYDDFVRRIQATHTSRDDTITTAEQWDAYVEEFLAEPVHPKPKKSLRKKAEKAAENKEDT